MDYSICFFLVVTQDDVYREAVTDGYLIDHLFLNSYTTESPRRSGISEESQQPSTGPEVSDVIEGSGDTSDNFSTSIFLQHGDKHHATTTQSVSHTETVQQPSTESKVNEIIEGSGDTNDKFLTSVFLQQRGKHYATTTQSVWQAQTSTSKGLLHYNDGSISDGSGSGDEDIHQFSNTHSIMTSISNTPTASSTSTADLSQNLAPKVQNSKAAVSGEYTRINPLVMPTIPIILSLLFIVNFFS